MAVRLTYTSGGIDSAAHAEFERRLRDARTAAPEPWPHLIGGRPRHEGAVFERVDPRTDRVASRAHAADPETVALAVAAAREACASGGARPTASASSGSLPSRARSPSVTSSSPRR